MSIKVTIEPQNKNDTESEQESVLQPINKNSIKMNMKLRRTLDGNIMVFDHKDIDMLIDMKKMKVITFVRGDFSDFAYAAQNRFFEFMKDKGVIDPSSIKGGHVYGSIEGQILKPVGSIPIDQIVILNIGKWIEEEKPDMEFNEQYEDYYAEYVTDPEDEDSTELGEVPQEIEKGTLPKSAMRRYTGGWR